MASTPRRRLLPRPGRWSEAELALVALGGAAGAALRWAVVTASGTAGTYPWWTLVVNVAGCLALGALVGAPRRPMLVLGTGVCGGLTTFSTFTVDVAELWAGGDRALAVIHVGASCGLGVAAVVVGSHLSRTARARDRR